MEDFGCFSRDSLHGYQHIGAMTQLAPRPAARYKGRVMDEIAVTAVTPSFVDIGREKVEYGRYLNDFDYQHNARVCVISRTW